jgi:molybdopterin-binding protein
MYITSCLGKDIIMLLFQGGNIMKISGRNKIKGKVCMATPGVVSAEVEVDAGNGIKIAGLITKASFDEMNIKVGDELTALVKATSVMFIKE